jgi:hypothetical protein
MSLYKIVKYCEKKEIDNFRLAVILTIGQNLLATPGIYFGMVYSKSTAKEMLVSQSAQSTLSFERYCTYYNFSCPNRS